MHQIDRWKWRYKLTTHVHDAYFQVQYTHYDCSLIALIAHIALIALICPSLLSFCPSLLTLPPLIPGSFHVSGRFLSVIIQNKAYYFIGEG